MRACQEVQGKERNEREKKPDGPKREGIDKRKRKEERRNVTDIQIQDNVTRVIMYFGRKGKKKKKFQRNYIKKEEKPLNGWCHSFECGEREKIRSSFLYKPIVATSNKLDGVVRGPEQFLCWRATAPALLVP